MELVPDNSANTIGWDFDLIVQYNCNKLKTKANEIYFYY